MRLIIISNAVIKGYHEFQIRPPQNILLPVTKEYGNRHDSHSCLVWIPEIDKIPKDLWNHVTDEKRGERVRTIAGLPIGRVPRGLSECFLIILKNSKVDCVEWYVQLHVFDE
ncbi:Hypothetical predicted protein [Paramuricea clavata]|uniref:Uncharacterized protein n=1 Tax=Paramuricea clavata TaxID=317549 RepID=A0A7D9HYK7_PARCT|nr:Hypothetical predicted protein [Paramuricea clavata]